MGSHNDRRQQLFGQKTDKHIVRLELKGLLGIALIEAGQTNYVRNRDIDYDKGKAEP